MSRLEPLDLAEIQRPRRNRRVLHRIFGFVPNGLRIMGRRPAIVEGFLHLRRVVVDSATSEVPPEFKDLIGHISSKAGGYRYCRAHTIFSADRADQSQQRLDALWEYRRKDRRTAGMACRQARLTPNAIIPAHPHCEWPGIAATGEGVVRGDTTGGQTGRGGTMNA